MNVNIKIGNLMYENVLTAVFFQIFNIQSLDIFLCSDKEIELSFM